MEAIASPPPTSGHARRVRYDDVARTLVHALKYQDRTDLAPAMAAGWRVRAANCSQVADMLVPVPLHWRRAWRRRYNQSGALARINRTAERREGAGEVLRRVAGDRAADRPVAAQRATNVQGAFPGIPDRQAEFRPSYRLDR